MIAALDAGGNASSVHGEGRAARNLGSRRRAKSLPGSFGLPPRAKVVFTSGGTEANALARCGGRAGRQLEKFIVSTVEHASVQAAAEQSGRPVGIGCRSTGNGIVDLAALRPLAEATGPEAALVSLMLAEYGTETGAIQPVAAAAELAHAHGASRPLRCRPGGRADPGRLARASGPI